jgi:peptidoglycan/LPS O-acetylase OafA/YrhL
MSYPIYLSHVFVFTVMTAFGRLGSSTSYVVALVATIIVSAALLSLIDAPVSRFRKSQLHARETFVPALRSAS